jgi:hypothetical protein
MKNGQSASKAKIKKRKTNNGYRRKKGGKYGFNTSGSIQAF